MPYRLAKDEEETQEPFDRIPPEEAYRMVESGEAVLIDVREQNEWDEGHMPKARHVPLQTFLSDPTKYVSPDQKVIFSCASGQRSAVAAEMAAAVGVKQSYNLEGGIKAWSEKGLPVEK